MMGTTNKGFGSGWVADLPDSGGPPFTLSVFPAFF
jgi:hypothetical protein